MSRRIHPLLALVVAVALVVAACSGGGDEPDLARSPTTTPTTAEPTSTSTTAAPTTTTTADPRLPAAVGDGEAGALLTPTGVIVGVVGREGEAYRVVTPCGRDAVLTAGTPLDAATVVLDPGHGGEESGAVGPNGLTEKELNLAVARLAKGALEAAGATVVLTRTGDYRVTLGARAAIAVNLRPQAFVSIHHNGGPDGPSDEPGTETFFQIASPESRRLAGLLYEELFALFSGYEGITWHADRDAGAKYRPNSRGGDYYGILRHSAGVTAALSEALFLSSSVAEAELLARPDVQRAEAEALTRAIVRFVTTDDPGSGYVEPYPRDEPAGSGGGSQGCIDPPLS